MPTASQPRRAAAIAALPVPVATSRTRQPACRSALSTSCSATSTMRAATTPKSPLDHACCWRCLMARRSGLDDSTVVVMASTVRPGVRPRHGDAYPYSGPPLTHPCSAVTGTGHGRCGPDGSAATAREVGRDSLDTAKSWDDVTGADTVTGRYIAQAAAK